MSRVCTCHEPVGVKLSAIAGFLVGVFVMLGVHTANMDRWKPDAAGRVFADCAVQVAGLAWGCPERVPDPLGQPCVVTADGLLCDPGRGP